MGFSGRGLVSCGQHRAVVIGAGVGGLVSALLLAVRGVEVTVVERAADAGRQDAADR